MPINPAAMQAFAADDGADMMAMEPEAPPTAEAAEDSGKFQALLPLLEEHAGEVEDCASGLEEVHLSLLIANPEQPPDESVVNQVQSDYDGLDEVMVYAMRELEVATADDCIGIAEHLANEGLIEDPDCVASWLIVLSNFVLPAAHDEMDAESDGESDADTDTDAAEPVDDGEDF